MILLPQPPECWDYRHLPLCPAWLCIPMKPSEHIHLVSLLPLSLPNFAPWNLTTMDPLQISLHVLILDRNGIRVCSPFCLVSFAQNNDFEIYPQCYVCHWLLPSYCWMAIPCVNILQFALLPVNEHLDHFTFLALNLYLRLNRAQHFPLTMHAVLTCGSRTEENSNKTYQGWWLPCWKPTLYSCITGG
jgi:hypothetical protein